MANPVPPMPAWVTSEIWERSESHRSVLLLRSLAPPEVRSLLNYVEAPEDDWQPVYPPSTDTPQ